MQNVKRCSFCKAKMELVTKNNRDIGNISVLNHDGNPVDITKAMSKLCARVMPEVSNHSQLFTAESESRNCPSFWHLTLK